MKNSTNPKKLKASKPKPQLKEYCDVGSQRDSHGNVVWPASSKAMENARNFIKECAKSNQRVLLCPDKDADGLSSGVILYRTLTSLGLSPELISVHLFSKGSSIHDVLEREAMESHSPAYIIVLDQGSRPAPPLVSLPNTKSLIIDHHMSDSFPEKSEVVSACHYPPVATSSLLSYELCRPLLSTPEEGDTLAYLALIGTTGDLGTTLKYLPPFPDLPSLVFKDKTHTKKSINDAVSLLNAPRRTAKYDVITAWTALLSTLPSSSPDSTDPPSLKPILTSPRLLSARNEINIEVERHTHTPPKFSRDGRIAVLRIHSAAQIHPVIATRWAGHLNSKKLEIVMCANTGYLAEKGMVNFSCRIARCARVRAAKENVDGEESGDGEGAGGKEVNIIESLEAAAALGEAEEGEAGSGGEENQNGDGEGVEKVKQTLRERMGESFARGHKEASGGIVPVEAFEELMRVLGVGEKPEKRKGDGEGEDGTTPKAKKVKTIEKSPQKNTLGNYFKKA